MKICPIDTVEPYALMLSPVYVYMPKNNKFVAVKAPLDFFSREELDRLRPFESFFLPESAGASLEFRDAAKRARALMSWQSARETELGSAPFELSDAVLRVIGSLWSTGMAIEPFFVTVFANEICDLIPEDLLKAAHDQDVVKFEAALFSSSWAVFLALHLGYCELSFLNRLRLCVFSECMDGVEPSRFGSSEVEDLVEMCRFSSVEVPKTFSPSDLARDGGRVGAKIASRLKRVELELVHPGWEPPSIYGPMGFAHG